jgi:aminopeptidase N
MRQKLAALFLATLFAVPAFADRLPQSVVPSNYRLHFVPDLATEKFSGEETISVDVKSPLSSIVLHAIEIEFDEVSVTSGGKSQKAEVSLDPKEETATLKLADPVAAGPATIAIRYRGLLNDQLRGFYIGKTARRKYAMTQFEPTDARRAFPSFDEPAFKATYDVTIVVDKGDTAISNAKAVSDTPGPGEGKHTITFERTAKMSTYLVALLVGDFQCVEGKSDGVPIRICAVPEKRDLGKYALTAGEHQVKFYNDYYAFRYPFGKLDVIGLPDFEAGAMENAGAITFRETALLLDEKTAALERLQGTAGTMAHEIAHMWFGDIVTMKWWDDIWLNEGFATWITSKPIAEWRPDWRMDIHNAQSTSSSLGVDSLATTRPIRSKAATSAQINELFDGIAYGKTAAVLRMLESYTGEEAFRDGIRAYIKKYAFDNARAEDFWTTMAQVSKKPIDKIMPTFVDQAGAPLVTGSATCADEKTKLTLSQRRMFTGSARFKEGTDQLWMIPVAVKNLADPRSDPYRLLLTKKEETFTLPGCHPHLFLNHEGRGFYRAAHAPEMLLGVPLTTALSAPEKVALLTSSWALVQNGQTDIAQHLQVIERFRNDREPAIVATIISELTDIHLKLVRDEQRPAFRAFVAGYTAPLLRELGWTPAAGEDDRRKQMRAEVIYTMGFVARDSETLQRARELAMKSLDDPSTLDPSLVDNVYGMAALEGNAALYDKLVAKMGKVTNPQDYYRYLYTLPAFENPELMQRTFALSLSPEMKSQDLPSFLGQLLAYPHARMAAWDYMRANWSELQKRFTTWGGARVVGASGALCDPAKRAEVAKWFIDHPVEASERSYKQALERIDTCLEFRTLQSASFGNWLAGRGGA